MKSLGGGDARWRIEFNGLGELDFCPVVRKTPALMARVQKDVLGQAQALRPKWGRRCWNAP